MARSFRSNLAKMLEIAFQAAYEDNLESIGQPIPDHFTKFAELAKTSDDPTKIIGTSCILVSKAVVDTFGEILDEIIVLAREINSTACKRDIAAEFARDSRLFVEMRDARVVTPGTRLVDCIDKSRLASAIALECTENRRSPNAKDAFIGAGMAIADVLRNFTTFLAVMLARWFGAKLTWRVDCETAAGILRVQGLDGVARMFAQNVTIAARKPKKEKKEKAAAAPEVKADA